MRQGLRTHGTRCAATVAVLAGALMAPATSGAATPPPPEPAVTGAPPPPIQGTPHAPPGLPCNVDGPAVDLGDSSHYVAGRGTLRALVLFVDFSDAAAGSANPEDVYNRLVPGAQSTLQRLAYGKFKLDATPYLQWVRMPRPLSAYGFGSGNVVSWDRHQAFIADAVHAADPGVDFSKYQAVYVVAGPGAQVPVATMNLAPGRAFKLDGKRIAHAVTLDGYGTEAVSNAMAHETGHVLGLPDLYKLGTNDDWDRYAGAWDIMSDVWFGGPMLAWTRREVGWLGNRDFRCVRRTETVDLTPVSVRGGIKAAVVRIDRRNAYIVEARTDVPGPGCPTDGILIYRFNGRRHTGDGPIQVFDDQPGTGACGDHTGALFGLASGERSRYRTRDGRVTVTLLRRGARRFRVRIQVRRTR